MTGPAEAEHAFWRAHQADPAKVRTSDHAGWLLGWAAHAAAVPAPPTLEVAVRRLLHSGYLLSTLPEVQAVVAALGPPRCVRCQGSGQYSYGNTSTWRRGIGGCAMTVGTCDRCWGSGDDKAPGPDLRAAWLAQPPR